MLESASTIEPITIDPLSEKLSDNLIKYLDITVAQARKNITHMSIIMPNIILTLQSIIIDITLRIEMLKNRSVIICIVSGMLLIRSLVLFERLPEKLF